MLKFIKIKIKNIIPMKEKSIEKNEIIKKILIPIVLILLVIVFYKYNILTTVQQKNYIYNDKTNCYYY